jgi:hypothetical protein
VLAILWSAAELAAVVEILPVVVVRVVLELVHL